MHEKSASKAASLAVVYITVFIDLLGFGIILPLLPFYALAFGASGLWIGVLTMAYSAAQFVGAPIVGRLSDRFGRRPIILLALGGSVASLTLAGCAGNLYILIAARALAGLFGGSIAAAQAYVADVTTPAERPKYMGLLGACIGMGFVFGPAIGAGLAVFGFGTAAFTAAGIGAANLLAASFLLRESRAPSANAASRPRRGFTFNGLDKALGDGSFRPVLLASFGVTLAFVAMETTYALLGAQRFDLNAKELGYVFTYLGIIVVIVQGGLIGRLVRRSGEQRIALIGAAVMAAGLIGIAAAQTLPWSIVALGILAAGQGLTSPTLATMLSKCASRDEQGATLGLGQSLAAAARATAPVMAGWLYDQSAGWPYVAAATVCLGAAWLIGSPELRRTLAAGGAGPQTAQG